MNNRQIILMVVFAIGLVGCASTDEETVEIPLENDPRIGASVDRICFTTNSDGWAPVDNDRNAIILTRGIRDSYKLKLVGVCDPDWAMFSVAFVKRVGSNCITRGDRVYTDSNTSMGYCTIMSINEWHPEAITTDASEDESSTTTVDENSEG